jgi:predicted SAM-dependent methyltransferase
MNREMEFPQAARSTVTAAQPRRLQLGCGGRFHPAWVNLDLRPLHSSVESHDVTGPLPFPDRHFDAVYHAHLLEHLPRASALPFVRECLRVLKPGGVLRVVVPDLEQIARLYLEAVPGAWLGDGEAQEWHTWAMLEMYDQMVREQPGGEMLAYLAREPANIAWYRLGADGTIIRQHLERVVAEAPMAAHDRPSLLRRLTIGWRERLIRWLLGREYGLLQLGRFRRSGEVHLWMYDRHSLRELLTSAGFVDFRRVSAGESAIPGWGHEHLDTQPGGAATKPDSLYVEAVRP